MIREDIIFPNLLLGGIKMGDWEETWAKEMEISEAQESLQKLQHAIEKMRKAEEKLNKLLVMLNVNH